ncbi:MAG: hypothetical protein V2A74_05835 [bacterium]
MKRFQCMIIVFGLTIFTASVFADQTAQTLPFTQNWTNTGLITTNDNWSGVPGIEGYNGNSLTTVNDTNPSTVTAEQTVSFTPQVFAQAAPSLTSGGVGEMDALADPCVALQGSGTADAPYLRIFLNTTGKSSIVVQYNLRDIDGTADNSVQQVALQFRVGSSGAYTNVPAAYVADATTGPSLDTLVTPINVTLPGACDNAALVELRIMTTNSSGSDEWVGVDDINIHEAASSVGGWMQFE